MNLHKALKKECIAVDSTSTDKNSVLKEIAALAKKSPALENYSENDIYNALAERETACTTGFENGIAIPHCRLKNISEFVVGVVVLPNGIDFASLDGKPTQLCFFIIGPEEHRDEHIRLLSMICRAFKAEGVKQKMLAAESADEIAEIIFARAPEGVTKQEEQCLITIYIQNEEAFLEILQLLSTLNASVAVTEGGTLSSHLHRLPLFSTFWNREDPGFLKIIHGIVAKKIVNETVREINVVKDELKISDGFLVTVQNLSYSSGSIIS